MEIRIHQLPKINLTANRLKTICRAVVKDLQLNVASLDVIFVDDATLRDMHREYLNDDTFTDVMTFNLGDDRIEGEIYISSDRAKEQAAGFGVTVQEEVLRLTIHGLLHLAGYEDGTPQQRAEMKKVEDRLVETYRDKFLTD